MEVQGGHSRESLESLLNEESDRGWKLVTILRQESEPYNYDFLIFEKEV
jgi:hypothetical protein